MLWYDKPTTDWEKEALPIGNGRIGAMVFGGVESERLQIAEKSLWTGGPGTDGGYDYGLPEKSQVALMRSLGQQLLTGTLEPEAVAKQLGLHASNEAGDADREQAVAEAALCLLRRRRQQG